MQYQNVVLVEGKNDSHVVGHLLIKAGVAYEFNEGQLKRNPDKIFIKSPKDEGGIDQLIKSLPLLISGETQHIAIIIDKDRPDNSKWNALKSTLENIPGWSQKLPQQPTSGGIIENIQINQHAFKVGIWVMPNNQADGSLEHFLEQLIPQNDKNLLWGYAKRCVENLPEKLFGERDSQKAKIFTWLAWQKEPGLPYGTSIGADFLDANAPLAQEFTKWIKDLFGQTITEINV